MSSAPQGHPQGTTDEAGVCPSHESRRIIACGALEQFTRLSTSAVMDEPDAFAMAVRRLGELGVRVTFDVDLWPGHLVPVVSRMTFAEAQASRVATIPHEPTEIAVARDTSPEPLREAV